MSCKVILYHVLISHIISCYVMAYQQAGWSGEKGTAAGPQRGRHVWEGGEGRSHCTGGTTLAISCRLPDTTFYLMSSSSLSHVVFIPISSRLHIYLVSSSSLSNVVFISTSCRLSLYLRSSSFSCCWGRAGSPQGWSGGSPDSLNLGHQTDQEWTAKSGVMQLNDSLKF